MCVCKYLVVSTPFCYALHGYNGRNLRKKKFDFGRECARLVIAITFSRRIRSFWSLELHNCIPFEALGGRYLNN